MDPITLTIAARFTGMVLLILGGIAAIWGGLRVFVTGTGSAPGRMLVQMHSLKISAHSVGPVIMATAIGWGWLGYLISPGIESSPDFIKVGFVFPKSIQTPAGTVTAPVVELPAKYTRAGEVFGWSSASPKGEARIPSRPEF